MKIFLKKWAQQASPMTYSVRIEKRLPPCMIEPTELACQLKVTCQGDYFLLNREVRGTAVIQCTRCSAEFTHAYHYTASLAVCGNDETAERLQHRYEVIVSSLYEIDLIEILTDDLYLFLPEKHPLVDECDAILRAVTMPSF